MSRRIRNVSVSLQGEFDTTYWINDPATPPPFQIQWADLITWTQGFRIWSKQLISFGTWNLKLKQEFLEKTATNIYKLTFVLDREIQNHKFPKEKNPFRLENALFTYAYVHQRLAYKIREWKILVKKLRNSSAMEDGRELSPWKNRISRWFFEISGCFPKLKWKWTFNKWWYFAFHHYCYSFKCQGLVNQILVWRQPSIFLTKWFELHHNILRKLVDCNVSQHYINEGSCRSLRGR